MSFPVCRHLGFNGLTGPVPEELTGLANLLILDISNNELTGEIPESYGNLTRLKRLLVVVLWRVTRLRSFWEQNLTTCSVVISLVM